MGDDLSLAERNCARTPMQWSDEPHGGFTLAAEPVLPVISGGAYGFEHVNVAAQRRDANSLLNWLERVCRMRKEVPEIGWGDFEVLPNANPGVLAIRYEWRNNAVLFLHNLESRPYEVELESKKLGDDGGRLANLLTEEHSHADADGRHRVLLEPYGYRWYRVGGLGYLLERSEV